MHTLPLDGDRSLLSLMASDHGQLCWREAPLLPRLDRGWIGQIVRLGAGLLAQPASQALRRIDEHSHRLDGAALGLMLPSHQVLADQR